MAEEVTDPGLLAILNGRPQQASDAVMRRQVLPLTPAQEALAIKDAAAAGLPILDAPGQPKAPTASQPTVVSDAQEVIDPALLQQLNTGLAASAPSTGEHDIGLRDIPEGFAALGTGLLRGGLSTAMMPFDTTNMIRKNLGYQPDVPGTQEAGDFMKGATGISLYEPQGRLQRDITAAGEMVPAMLSRNPQAIIAALGGGALGQEASQEWPRSPLFADAPWTRALGNVVGMAGTALALHPKVSAKLAIQALPGGTSAWESTVRNIDELANALKKTQPVRPPVVPLPPREVMPLPPTSKAGQVEDLAGALLRPKVAYDLPRQISNITSTEAFGYLKALWRALGIPEIQYQANQEPSMQVAHPGAIIGQ